jgi:hypothetical protein
LMLGVVLGVERLSRFVGLVSRVSCYDRRL